MLQLLPLLLVVVVGSDSSSLEAGIDEISSTLSAEGHSCSPPPLSPKLEESVAQMEKIIDAQWESINKSRENVESATIRAREMIAHFYEVSPTEAPDACSAPFERAAGSCFWAHKNPSLSWDKARSFCQQEDGADLATPDDIQAVIDFLQSKFGREWLSVWFGGKKNFRGDWKWLDTDEPMGATSSQWHQSSRADDGPCAYFSGGRGFKIQSEGCDISNWFLCEKKLTS